jgi:transposase InsO family protein
MLTLLHRLLHLALHLCRLLLRWLRPQSRPRWPSPRTGGPIRRPHAHPKPAWVRREIIRLKALMPEAGCRTLAHCFNRRFAVPKRMTVGKTYVADTIRRHQYAILAARRRLKHAMPRPVPRNLIWGMDLAVKTDLRGRQHLVLAIVEHASRACLCLQRLTDKCALTVLQSLTETIRQYGRPGFLRTDNEAVFTSWRVRLVLRVLGIRPQRTAPHCPWQNGRVERFIGTVKRALAGWDVADGVTLDEALREVRTWYNHERPHDHLKGRTPAEVWAGVDVFADTPQAAMWRKRWERQWRLACQASPWGGG